MNWHQKHQYRHDNRTAHRFNRVKAHRGPCGGWAAVMMDCMSQPEKAWAMHGAVRPVKPAILHKQVDQQGKRPVPQRQHIPIQRDLRPAILPPAPQDNASGNAINRRGEQRPADFLRNLLAPAGIQAGVRDVRYIGKQPAC